LGDGEVAVVFEYVEGETLAVAHRCRAAKVQNAGS
jgi:hypothetical protein